MGKGFAGNNSPVRRVIALGFFDGVHLGHGKLLNETARLARELNAVSSAITFDRHPKELLTKTHIPLLTSVSERGRLMRLLYGIEDCIVINFNSHERGLDWRDFIKTQLAGEYGAVGLAAGEDFCFGYKREGNAEKLKGLCGELGIACTIVGKVCDGGTSISSTVIRELIALGEIEKANHLLGHCHIINGKVTEGNRIGSSIGYPTVNLPLSGDIIHPAFGVYKTKTMTPRGEYAGLTNIGVRPTVSESGAVLAETTLLGFDEDLYGQEISICLEKYLRPEKKFNSLEELKRQIDLDMTNI